MTGEMIEEMRKTEDETEAQAKKFRDSLEKHKTEWQRENPDGDTVNAPWHKFLRWAIWDIIKGRALICIFLTFFAELCVIGYTYFIVYLVEFLQDPDMPLWYEGIMRLAVFSILIMLSIIVRNQFMLLGGIVAIDMRKAIISAMYDKIGSLSVKSLAETNSGKLISLVSSDLF